MHIFLLSIARKGLSSRSTVFFLSFYWEKRVGAKIRQMSRPNLLVKMLMNILVKELKVFANREGLIFGMLLTG